MQIRGEIRLSMVDIGQDMRADRHSDPIAQLEYRPTGPNSLDLEILSASDLRRRVAKSFFQATHQFGFHMLLCVTRGECTHVVDFEPVACGPGSLLAIRPTQVHRFDSGREWDGWIALFQAQFLPPSNGIEREHRVGSALESLPISLPLDAHELRVVTQAMEQMRQDCGRAAAREQVHALLQHQMCALLLRLDMLRDGREAPKQRHRIALQRFKSFQRLVERRFSQWHGVAEYASRLGCSEKSLTRASMEGAGLNAKRFITARINLEAKRLLAHTDLPIAVIAERFGFEDPTHFVKVFKRGVGFTPGEFRRRQSTGARRV
jgi:AraC-like DNA-binding protein